MIKTYTFTGPIHWAVYFINDDPSGMTDREIRQADRWLGLIRLGAPVDASEVGFLQWHDARLDDCFPYAADCAEYTFLSIE